MGEVKTKPVNTGKEERKEPTYEQLKNWCDQLLMQRNQLAEKLNQVSEVLNKLPWLFKVIENSKSFSPEFVDICKQEIEYIMIPPAEESSEKEDKDNKDNSKE